MMDGNDTVASANSLKNGVTYTIPENGFYVHEPMQPIAEYCYKNQLYEEPQNCVMFSAAAVANLGAPADLHSYPFVQTFNEPPLPQPNPGKRSDYVYSCYRLINDLRGYSWLVPKNYVSTVGSPYFQNICFARNHRSENEPKLGPPAASKWRTNPVAWYADDGAAAKRERSLRATVKYDQQKLGNKMHPVQLLHQLFRKEAFVMEYERVNDGPFSRVRVTYKVNGKSYVSEATRLKEARRLCAKQVLRDQFPDLQIESDTDIPQLEYDVSQFDNKHPVQILYQIFRYEPMEMHCEEEGAAHFAKHIFTFVIRGVKYRAKAETIKEAKRRAAILALNDYFKKSASESNEEEEEVDSRPAKEVSPS